MPRDDPATICTRALINRVSSSSTVALRASSLATLKGQKGINFTRELVCCSHAGSRATERRVKEQDENQDDGQVEAAVSLSLRHPSANMAEY